MRTFLQPGNMRIFSCCNGLFRIGMERGRGAAKNMNFLSFSRVSFLFLRHRHPLSSFSLQLLHFCFLFNSIRMIRERPNLIGYDDRVVRRITVRYACMWRMLGNTNKSHGVCVIRTRKSTVVSVGMLSPQSPLTATIVSNCNLLSYVTNQIRCNQTAVRY